MLSSLPLPLPLPFLACLFRSPLFGYNASEPAKKQPKYFTPELLYASQVHHSHAASSRQYSSRSARRTVLAWTLHMYCCSGIILLPSS